MGGRVSFGYEVQDRKLVINEAEAEIVRHVMQRYIALASVPNLIEELDRNGYRTKPKTDDGAPGSSSGKFHRGMLYHLLAKPIYRGITVHKGQQHVGEHEAIVAQELWDAVQRTIADRTSGSSRRLKARQPSLLVGMLTDGEGRAMTPSHATKPGIRYRHYITRPDQSEGAPAWRVSAHDLEKLVCERIAAMLLNQQLIAGLVAPGEQHIDNLHRAFEQGDLAAAMLRSGSVHARAELLARLAPQVALSQGSISISVDPLAPARSLGVEDDLLASAEPIELHCAATKIRRGLQLRLIIPGPEQALPRPTSRDEKLVALVAEAYAAKVLLLLQHPGKSIGSIAASENRCRTRLAQLVGLSCLAPDITTAIVEGRQPAALTPRTLLGAQWPMSWAEQRSMLGFS